MHKTPERKHACELMKSNGMGTGEQSVIEGSSVATVDDETLFQKIMMGTSDTIRNEDFNPLKC